ncbi:hypothetical protein Anas_09471, partial [Armadillidium nasatum]
YKILNSYIYFCIQSYFCILRQKVCNLIFLIVVRHKDYFNVENILIYRLKLNEEEDDETAPEDKPIVIFVCRTILGLLLPFNKAVRFNNTFRYTYF